MKKLLLIAALAASLTSCGVDPGSARRALEAQGITNVTIGGYAWFGCSKGDNMRSRFVGIGANGKVVSGVVCGGWMKGTTVRYD
ncbi:hypothetical protein [Agrobacterium sp. CG674]